MKKNVFVVFAAVMLTLISCSKERITGNGSVITETRNINNFKSVSVSGSTNVYITEGAVFKVEVKGYNNLLPYFETKLVNTTLELGYKENTNVRNDNTEVFITMPVLEGLVTEGSGNISTTGTFSGTTNFNVNTFGSGNVSISQGSSQNFYSSIEGSGNINALNFVADKVEATISGSGNVEITANNTLKVVIAGSGNVYYRGTPIITSTISGSGSIIPR